MAAPVTVIIAWDTEFHENLPRLFPQFDMRSYFVGNHTLINETAFRNSSLQRLLDEGTIRPDVATVYVLQDAAQAWKDIARKLPGVHGMSPSGPGAARRTPHGKDRASCRLDITNEEWNRTCGKK